MCHPRLDGFHRKVTETEHCSDCSLLHTLLAPLEPTGRVASPCLILQTSPVFIRLYPDSLERYPLESRYHVEDR